MKCENCNKQHAGSYGSGRFCSSTCARSFSTKKNRSAINNRVSLLLSKEKKKCQCGKILDYRNKSGYCARCKPKNEIQYFCINCGESISKSRSKRCVKCSMKHKEQEYIKEWLSSGNTKTTRQPQNYIRRFILKQQNNKCSICGIDPYWNDKPIVFILDHIDGNCHNNNRDNLRLICPMCDSQLPTFKSKNKNSRRRRKQYSILYK